MNMDYKTNHLSKELETKDNLLPEFTGLHFTTLGEDIALFDYTAYFEENELEPIDYKVFMRLNKHFINTIAKLRNLNTANLFYQNTNGHILVAGDLVFLFLAFANPALLNYFIALLTEIITDGVAVSNGYLYSNMSDRIPSDVLENLIIERQNDSEHRD